ncbi:RnfABCDGE type electron transport complex subunit D [Paenibacillus sp. FSL R5-0519]|uniref:RnfABCDGE type electron transport complex subunit D n=1 Tax=Paenibacillus sp. FSL R5-0519 TaxID=2921648 RepID=UPI0030DBC3CD
MTLQQWIKSPKGYVVMVLTAYLVIASLVAFDIKGIVHGVVAVGVAVVVDMMFGLVNQKKRITPDGALITGLLVALILSTSVSWGIVAATVILSIVSKYVLVSRKKPIFNPAALGLMLSVMIFGAGESWWGAFGDLPIWMMVFLLLGGYRVTGRVNKFPQIFSFLGTYFVLMLVMGLLHTGDAGDALRAPFINAVLFCGFFMVTDLPTSPAKTKDQFVFGILAASVGALIYGLFGGLMYLFVGLLCANLYHFLRVRFAMFA